MHRILDNGWGFHGRVASREQVQIQISFPHHKDWVDLFMGWWEYGIRSWRERAPKDATLTFLCELGPKEYAMTGAGRLRTVRSLGGGEDDEGDDACAVEALGG